MRAGAVGRSVALAVASTSGDRVPFVTHPPRGVDDATRPPVVTCTASAGAGAARGKPAPSRSESTKSNPQCVHVSSTAGGIEFEIEPCKVRGGLASRARCGGGGVWPQFGRRPPTPITPALRDGSLQGVRAMVVHLPFVSIAASSSAQSSHAMSHGRCSRCACQRGWKGHQADATRRHCQRVARNQVARGSGRAVHACMLAPSASAGATARVPRAHHHVSTRASSEKAV